MNRIHTQKDSRIGFCVYLSVILGFISLGILSRLLPHPPNFTALNAIALFSATHLKNRGLALATVFASLFLSDFLIGFHSTMPSVYIGFGVTAFLGYRMKNNASFQKGSVYCLASSLLFFLMTNFEVWLKGSLYPMTTSGLALCYFAAIPFLVNQLAADLIYGALICSVIHAKRNSSAQHFLHN